MSSKPRYWGTKQGKIIKAITIDSIHNWMGLHTATKFTDRELNYHLMLLFKDEVLIKKKYKYYIIPTLEAEYKRYYNVKSTAIQKTRKKSSVKTVAFWMIVILLSLYTIDSFMPKHIEINKITICTNVIDGDTFEINNGYFVRLADIDAPEDYEYGYESASNALSTWILGKKVYLDIDDIYGTDVYGRYVCVVYVASGTSYVNVNKALLNGRYADISNYQNEFNPSNWKLYINKIDTSQANDESGNISPSVPRSSDSGSSSGSSTSTRYVGSKNSNIYHELSCYWAGQINPSNKIYFSSNVDAQSKGYRPCKVCKP